MSRKQFIIGITGGSGVGKTTLINKLMSLYGSKITTVSLDDYYLPLALQKIDTNGIINFDLPSAIDTKALEYDITSLRNQHAVKQKVYHFNHPEKLDEYRLLIPRDILIIEGLFVLHYPFVRYQLDYSVYITVSEDKQLERRLKRDKEERNYSEEAISYQWLNHVKPAYDEYVKPYMSKANLIIDNDDGFDQNLFELVKVIEAHILH